MARHGKPDIFNTDQGTRFTGQAFTGVLADNGIAISVDGKGAWRDSVSSNGSGAASNTRGVYLRAYDCVQRGAQLSAGVPIQVLTAARRIKPTSPRRHPLGGLAPAEASLIDAETLFRQPGPTDLLDGQKLERSNF